MTDRARVACEPPLRVCLLSSDYAVDVAAGGGGGIETYVRGVARGLADRGHDVHVIAPTLRDAGSFVDAGVHVHPTAVPDVFAGHVADLPEARGVLSFAWLARRQVHRLIAADGPFDVVEAPDYKAQGVFLARDPDVPLVVKCHAHLLLCLALNGIPLEADTALIADLEREALHGARAIHVNSNALAARCATDYDLPVARFRRVPYGIDARTFRPAPGRLRADLNLANVRVVLFVGRLEGRKGIATLVPAFVEVARRCPDAVLIVAGPDTNGPPGCGSNEAWMRTSFAAAGVAADRVRFLGTVPNAALPALYSAADVMVAPSAFEAFGLVYLEAMACGCPPVASRAGGASEVIADETTGLLVPPDDPAALADRLVALLDAPDRRHRLAAAGRAVVEREFTIEAMVTRTERFYRGIAA